MFGLLVLGAGGYIGWIFYQAGQGDLVEVKIKQVDVELNLKESIVQAIIEVVVNRELDLELSPEVRVEIELDNPSMFAVTIHEIEGELTVEGMELDYEIRGLENDRVLASGDDLSFYIEIDPNMNETLRIARGSRTNGYSVAFDGSARFSIFGVEQEVPIQVEEIIQPD